MIARPTARTVTSVTMAAPIVAFGALAWSRRWMSDDGYIYLRVVRQLLDGNGPVFNRGERVETATSPLWVGLLAGTKEVFRPVDLPWLAVVLGLALSIAGLALAQWGAYRLWSRPAGRPRTGARLGPSGRRRGVIVPFGALVVVALPPFWDFATSGLETGLSFAWLGACFCGLTRLVAPDAVEPGTADVEPRASSFELRSTTFLPVLLGLGPLIRPDFALYSIAFLAALLLIRPSMTLRARTQAIVLALALPFAYEVFRMGYYAALVPNPAFAKEASTPNVAQGWHYLVDTIRPYWLFVPALLVASSTAPWLATRPWRTQRSATVLIALTIMAGVVHGAYVIYVGGDFMHARMLLPAIFALLMPFAVIEIDGPRALVPALGMIVWAIVCAALLRPAYDGIGPHGIANERAYYVSFSQNAHPITLNDYLQYWAEDQALLDQQGLSPNELLLLFGQQMPLRAGFPSDAAVLGVSVGIYGYVFTDDVHVIDLHGLADPIAGRLELASRGRPGHEKLLPEAWVVARFADPSAPLPATGPSEIDVAAAREALSCGDLRRLLGATSDPMTPGRFARNIFDAFRLHRLRIPPDPSGAQRKLC